jgi:hypothetical protein
LRKKQQKTVKKACKIANNQPTFQSKYSKVEERPFDHQATLYNFT